MIIKILVPMHSNALSIHSGTICRKNKVFYHCDAAQAIGKIPIDVEAMNIDLMSISGHKVYGPKGFFQYSWCYFLNTVSCASFRSWSSLREAPSARKNRGFTEWWWPRARFA